MATSVGDIFIKLGLDKKPFLRGMSEVENTAGGLAGSIGKKIAGGLSLAGLTKFASDCIYAGSKLNAMRSMASVAFPSMTKEVEAFAKNASSSFGLSEKMALQYTSTLGSMARGMGFNEQQALSLSSAIAGLSGDVASYYSMSQDEAFSKMQSIFTGETESLKSLGVIMTQNALDQYALANGFGMTTSAMSEQEKVVLRYQFVMSQLQLAQGDFMRTQSAWGNQVKILKMRFAELQAQLGQGLINVLKPAIRALNFFMGKLIQVASVFNAFIARITGASKKKKGGLKNFASGLYDIGKASKGVGGNLGGIGGGAGKVAKGAKKASKAVKQLQRDMMGFDKMNKLSKRDNSSAGGGGGGVGGGGGGGLGDIGGYEGDIDGLNKKLFDFSEISKKIKGSKIWKALGEVFQAVIRLAKAVGKALAPVGKWILEHLVKPFGRLIGMAIVGVLEGISGAIELVAKIIEKHPRIFAGLVVGLSSLLAVSLAFKKVINPLRVSVLNAGGALKFIGKFISPHGLILAGIIAVALGIGYIYKNWDKIKKTKFGKVLIAVGNKLKEVGKVLKAYFGERIKATIKVVKTAWAVLKKVGSFLSKTFKKAIEAVSHPLETLKNAWAGIKDKTVNLKAKVAEGAENLLGDLSENIKDITVDIKAKVATKWSDIKSSWEGLTDNIKDKVASMKATVGTIWSNIKTAWGNVVDNVKDKTASMKAKVGTTWNDIKKTWNNLMSHVKDKTATLKVQIKTVLAKGWNSLVRKLRNSGLPPIKAFGKKLPLLAQGGWVDKNTPQLAVVGDNRHESEIVAPDSKLMAMARQASQEAVANSSNAQVVALLTQLLRAVNGLDTNVYLDGKEIANNTVKRINQQTRTTGSSPLLV